jgi:glucose 1-dehydrogenase
VRFRAVAAERGVTVLGAADRVILRRTIMYGGYRARRVVTGGGSGMGRAMCIEFARTGHRRHRRCQRSGWPMRALAATESAGGTARVLLRRGQGKRTWPLGNSVLDNYGRLDFAVNNAALGSSARRRGKSPGHRRSGCTPQRQGVFFCMPPGDRALAQRGGGAIVNVASMYAFRPQPHRRLHLTKHAVSGSRATRRSKRRPRESAQRDLPRRDRDTPMLQAARARAKHPDGGDPQISSLIDRIGRPQEVAQAALWLCPDDGIPHLGHAGCGRGYLARGCVRWRGAVTGPRRLYARR